MTVQFYKNYNYRKYDYSLILKADALTRGANDGEISLADMKVLWEHAQNGGNPKEFLQQTFEFILSYRKVSEDARKWYLEQAWLPKSLEDRIQAIIHDRFGLKYLRWDIPKEEVARQLEIENQQSFDEALTQALTAILYDLQPLDTLNLNFGELPWNDPILLTQRVRDYLNYFDNEATLSLIPLDFQAPEPEEGYNAHELMAPQTFWTFHIPATYEFNHEYIAQVRRTGFEQVLAYSMGNFGYANPTDMTRHIINREMELEGMRWEIDPVTVGKQMLLKQPLGFYPALRAALTSFLKEDAGGLRSIVSIQPYALKQEEFGDPAAYEVYMDHLVQLHLRESIMRLLPLNLDSHVNGFEPPEGDESVEDNWIFQLEIPRWGDYIFWAVVDRKGEKKAYNYHFN